MRQKQILKNGLVCAGEHLECENYAADKQTLLRVVNLKAGDYYFRDKTEHSFPENWNCPWAIPSIKRWSADKCI